MCITSVSLWWEDLYLKISTTMKFQFTSRTDDVFQFKYHLTRMRKMNPKAIYPILLKKWLKSASVLTLVTRTLDQANHHHHHNYHQHHHHRMVNDLCALRIYPWCIYDVAFLLTDRKTDSSFFLPKMCLLVLRTESCRNTGLDFPSSTTLAHSSVQAAIWK